MSASVTMDYMVVALLLAAGLCHSGNGISSSSSRSSSSSSSSKSITRPAESGLFLRKNRQEVRNFRQGKATIGVSNHCNGTQPSTKSPRLFVLVPGLGSASRAEIVRQNLIWLHGQGVPFDCRIYVYESEEVLPLDAQSYSPCDLVRHPGQMVDHMLALGAEDWGAKAGWEHYLLLWLDAVMPLPDVSLQRMLDVMRANCLEGFSLSDNLLSKHRVHSVMRQNLENPVGRLTDFMEFNFNVFSRRAWLCLQEKVADAKVNNLGWGVDALFGSICKAAIGISDSMSMLKLDGGSYNHNEAQRMAADLYRKHSSVPRAGRVTLGLLEKP